MVERIRPSLRDLANSDYDELAFPELEGGAPAVRVTRARPPTIASSVASTSSFTTSPVPTIPQKSDRPEEASRSRQAAPKPKSRFALQREREAAERARATRFEVDLDEDIPEAGVQAPKLIGSVIERGGFSKPPAAPSLAINTQRQSGPIAPTLFSEASAGSGVETSRSHSLPLPATEDDAISSENDAAIAAMSQDEILEAQRQIKEEMGLSEGIIRMLQKRAGDKARHDTPVSPAAATEATPRSTFSLRREAAENGQIERLGPNDPEEGSPEYIRQHFFPNEDVNPDLEWMAAADTSSDEASTSAPSFDLNGISRGARSINPSTPGDSIHVSSSTHFTIASLLSMAASSVASQRSTSYLVLYRILFRPENATILGFDSWASLRMSAVTKATRAIRDASLSVVGNALQLLAHVLETETVQEAERRLDNQEALGTVFSCFGAADPYSALALHLSLASLPQSSLTHILTIVSSIVRSAIPNPTPLAILNPLISTPNFLESISERFVAVPWPPTPSSAIPNTQAVELFSLLAKSSRKIAKALWQRDLVEPSMRFLAVLPWDYEDQTLVTAGRELLSATLDYWTSLARYGLGTSLRTRAASTLTSLAACAVSEPRVGTELLNLLALWTIAAINPHSTGHDILWSHVDEWADLAVSIHDAVVNSEGEDRDRLLAASWSLLASWIEGSKVNKSWRGERERLWVKERIGPAFAQDGAAMKRVTIALRRLDGSHVKVAICAFRLAEAFEESVGQATASLCEIPESEAIGAIDAILGQATPSRSAVSLAGYLLQRTEARAQVALACRLVHRFEAGEEVVVRDLINRIVSHALPASHILAPFLTHAIAASSASGGRVAAPLFPNAKDLSITSFQYPWVSSKPILTADWPMVAFDELLRSGASEVFKRLPADWNGSELELVRQSLTLMIFVRESSDPNEVPLTPSQLLYDLIKVFMLEKDDPATVNTVAETDIFRDEQVSASMLKLLAPHRLGQLGPQKRNSSDVSLPTIEQLSASVSSAPFYKLYTDLLGLYDSMSLGDQLFAAVITPPISMRYPVDFRRLFWVDYAHMLRTIKVCASEAVMEAGSSFALSGYLYPLETDPTILGAYASALVNGKIGHENEFLEFIAIHHLNGNLFASHGVAQLALAKRLATTLATSLNPTVLQRLVAYQQGEVLLLPPQCYERHGDYPQAKLFLQLLSDPDADRLTKLGILT